MATTKDITLASTDFKSVKSLVRERLMQECAMITPGRDRPCETMDEVRAYQRLLAAQRQQREFGNMWQIPRHSKREFQQRWEGHLQMEQVAATLLGGVAKPLLGKAEKFVESIPVVGQIAKTLFGDGSYKDTPSVINSEAGNMGVVDLPAPLNSCALSIRDMMGDEAAVLDHDSAAEGEFLLNRLKVDSRIEIVNWSTLFGSGTLLAKYVVSPAMCATTVTPPNTVALNTVLSYFQSVYTFWRGGLRFTFECLPTHFHQGQLFIAFNPNLDNLTLVQARNCTAATIDLGVTNRTSMDIPFVARADYLRTSLPGDIAGFTLDNSLGTIHLFVQNALITNGTVAGSIDINVYISALDDFEFKVPKELSRLTKFSFQGIYQMDSEVVRDVAVAVPVHAPQQGYVEHTSEGVRTVANVRSADTDNVMEREYLLSPGNLFPTSSVVGATLSEVRLPLDFWSSSLAPAGFHNYHEFFRMGFKITIRINPTQFHQGSLILFWVPLPHAGNLSGQTFNSYTQFPHALMNVATETSMELIVPYSSLFRMLRNSNSMGIVRVAVWNVLRAPATASQALSYSIWIQALSPHMTVKKAFTGVLQSDRVASDTARGSSTQQLAFAPDGKSMKGHIVSDHMNVLSLLRRPCFVSQYRLGENQCVTSALDNTTFTQVWRTPAFCGRTHMFLAISYVFCSGGNRLTITTNAGKAVSVSGFAYSDFDVDLLPSLDAAVVYPATASLDNLFRGGLQWNVNETPQNIVEVPHYRRGPLSAFQPPFDPAIERTPVYFPAVNIGFATQEFSGAEFRDIYGYHGIRSFLYHSVGDDFHIYFPQAVVFTQYPTPVVVGTMMSRVYNDGDVEEDSVDGDPDVTRQELLRAGIESNPGPELSIQDYMACGFLQVEKLMQDLRVAWDNPNFGENFDLILDAAVCVGDDTVRGFTIQEAFDMDSLLALAGAVEDIRSLQGVLQIGEAAAVAGADRVVGAISPALDAARDAFESVRNLTDMAAVKLAKVEDAIQAKASSLTGNALGRAYEMLTTIRDVVHAVLSLGGTRVVQVLSVWKLIDLFSQHIGRDCVLVRQLEKLVRKTGVLQGGDWFEFVSEHCVAMTSGVIGVILRIFGFGTSRTSLSMLMLSLRELSEGQTVGSRVALFVTSVIDYVFEGTGMLKNFAEVTEAEQIAFATKFAAIRKTIEWDRLEILTPLVKSATRFKKMSAAGFRMPVDLMRNVEEVQNQAVKLEAQSRVRPRIRPTTWYLYGKSQQGKSYLQHHIIPALFLNAAGLCKFGDVKEQVYAIPGVDVKHWEGYNGQMVANLDDVFTISGPEDAQRIITLVSPEDYAVPKAAIEGKKDKFVSVALGISSNTYNFTGIQGLNNPVAVEERVMENMFEVEANKSKADTFLSDLEPGVLKTAQDMKDFCDKHWIFHKMTVSGGSVVKTRYSMNQIVEDLVVTYKKYTNETNKVQECIGKLQGDSSVGDFEDASDHFIVSAERLDELVNAVEHDHREGVLEANWKVLSEDVRKMANCLGGPKFGVDLDTAIKRRDICEIAGAMFPEDQAPVWRGFVSWLAAAGVVASCIGLCVLAWKAMTGTLRGELQASLYDGNVAVRTKNSLGKVKPVLTDNGVFEKVRKCIRWIELYHYDDPEYGQNGMHCVVMQGRYILLPNHFYEQFLRQNKHDKVAGARLITPEGRKFPFALDATNSVRVNGLSGSPIDLRIVYLFGVPMAGTPKLIGLIPTLKEVKRYTGQEIDCTILASATNRVRDDVAVRVETRFYGTLDNLEETEEMEMFVAKYAGQEKTTYGDCGRPYICRSSGVQAPFVALHSAMFHAPYSACGGTQLVRENIEIALAQLERMVNPVLHVTQTGGLTGDGVVPEGWLTDAPVLGKCVVNDVPLEVHVPLRTTKVRWLRSKEWTDEWRPSAKGVVKVGEEPDVLYVNTLESNVSVKYVSEPNKCIGNAIFQKCVKFYAQQFPKFTETWTDDQAINGHGIMDKLNMHTSTGYWSKYFTHGKTEVFEMDREDHYTWTEKAKTFVIPELDSTFVERYEEADREITIGNVPVFLWVSSNKDELRAIEKVKLGKTRVFEMPPLEFSLLVRKYFGPFLNHMKANPGFETMCAVGIDKETVWNAMWQGLRGNSDIGFDVDYSNYDGSVTPIAFDFFRAVTDCCLPEETKQQRHCLLHVLQHSYVLCRETVFLTEQGNKSGNPMTDIFNSVTNVFIILLSYLYGRGEAGLSLDFEQFNREVRAITYGDDVICSVARHVKYFSRETVFKVAAGLGMKVTSASKGVGIIPLEPLKNLSFIKLNFREEAGVMMCPLPKDVIWRMVQWTERGNLIDFRVQRDILDGAMRCMAHHGRQSVEDFARQVKEAGERVKFDYDLFYLDMIEKQEGYEFPLALVAQC